MRERFFEKVDITPGCWLWMAATNAKGYGWFGTKTKVVKLAHRVSWELHIGHIGDMCVCHRCDTPACVNPGHLFLGTHDDNMADMSAKGRGVQLFGERHGGAKLTEARVLEMRQRRARGETYSAMAREYGVNHSTVARACKGYRWRSVP